MIGTILDAAICTEKAKVSSVIGRIEGAQDTCGRCIDVKQIGGAIERIERIVATTRIAKLPKIVAQCVWIGRIYLSMPFVVEYQCHWHYNHAANERDAENAIGLAIELYGWPIILDQYEEDKLVGGVDA